VTLSSVQLAMASGVVILLAPFDAQGPVSLDLPVVASMLALGILGTGVAYVLYTRVLRDWGAVRASTVTYLAPVVGVVLGVLVLGESVHWYEPVGGIIVVAGIVISQGAVGRRWRASARRDDAVPAPSVGMK
jgi:drug/metabolite transporter (DMT)-like permease